jgi:hypothetical protein
MIVASSANPVPWSDSSADLLSYLAYETWQRITAAHVLRVSLGEETLTDMNVLRITGAAVADVAVQQVSRRKEREIASVDRAKPAICRHFKTGHFR